MKHLKFLFLAILISTSQAAQRPNFLIVLFDDLGFSDLGCYGGEIATPNIDTLGNNGLRFSRMTNSARCCPSRASLLTGLHPGQTGIPNFGGELVDRCVTLGEVMGANGYQTYAVGKWHVGHQPTDRGFDVSTLWASLGEWLSHTLGIYITISKERLKISDRTARFHTRMAIVM